MSVAEPFPESDNFLNKNALTNISAIGNNVKSPKIRNCPSCTVKTSTSHFGIQHKLETNLSCHENISILM